MALTEPVVQIGFGTAPGVQIAPEVQIGFGNLSQTPEILIEFKKTSRFWVNGRCPGGEGGSYR